MRYPFLLVFVLLIALLQSGISELVAGLSGLGVLAAYYVVSCIGSGTVSPKRFSSASVK
ncbi:MAG: hypothetical protein ACLTZY_15180 [Alistipes indistinctus]